jgi:hypothetical protein
MNEIKEETIDTEEFIHAGELFPIDLWMIKQKNNHCRGEILTVLDAVLGGDPRLKSTKDLVHNAFNGLDSVLHTMAYTGSEYAKGIEATIQSEIERVNK